MGAFLFAREIKRSLEQVGDLVDAGLDAGLVLFAARRAGRTDRADRLLTDLDRKCTLVGDDVREMYEPERRVGFQAIDQSARRRAEGACGVSLAKAVLDGVRPSIVAAHLQADCAIA